MKYEVLKMKKNPWNIVLPKGIEKYAHTSIRHPIIYDRFKKRAFCISCGEYFDYVNPGKSIPKARTVHVMERFTADEFITCPLCGHEGKANPHTRNVFIDNAVAVGNVKTDSLYINVLYACYEYEQSSFADLKELKGRIYTAETVKIAKSEQTAYTKWGKSWFKCNNVHICAETTRMRPHIHESMARAVRESFLRYAGIEIEQDSRPDINVLVKRLAVNAKHPQLEYLKKAGLGEIESGLIYGASTFLRPNWRRNDLPGVLGITSQDIDKLRQWKLFDVDHIAAYKHIKKYHKKIRKKDMEDFFAFFDDIGPFVTTTQWGVSLKGMDPLKTARYLEKLYQDNRPYCGHGIYGYSRGLVLGGYKDYIGQIRELKYPETDYYLYAKDFTAAHERASAQLREKKKKEYEEEVRAKNEKLAKQVEKLEKLSWSDGTYLIRPLRSAAEFLEEGANNNNCVASYTERAANGKTSIFVIRKCEAPDESFVTLEFRDGEIAQCRGKGNRDAGIEVDAFAERWLEEVVKRKQKGAAAPAA
ncbi:PcfJ domain-containing protein [Emergencia sp. JLR.KK010]|uniref:PcfJ domain-containing protein n=1 Tax=Emergencia sp. JLR.KK010 TaxID=3114296 RepID=UPI0030D03D98